MKPIIESLKDDPAIARDKYPRLVALKYDDSVERDRRIRVKNRRKMYLDKHPSYFESPELELADPLLYDRCVRRFQTAAEREVEGRSKGYSGVLEADLYRSEAKLAALQNHGNSSSRLTDFSSPHVAYGRGPDGQVLQEEPDEVPANKEEGMKRWRYEMTMRFLKGEDTDFSYKEVDEGDIGDEIASREVEDQWIEDEEPRWIDTDNGRQGDTGIQDF